MFRPFKTALLAGISVLALCAGQARAQSIDYGSMEQMFGEPITTSVTGTPQRVSEAAAAMTIVTQDDIRRSGADNIPDVLQFVLGVDTRRYSFGQSDVAIRGYDAPASPRMLVLVNGRQVYLDDYGYVSWDAIPVQLSEIRQIEIVKGPNSALFGFNAAAGVINIITYDPLFDSTNTATVRGGTQRLGEGEAVTTVHLGKNFGARVSVGGYTARDFAQPPGGGYPDPRNGRINVDLRWQVAPRIELRAEAGLVDNRYTAFLPTANFALGDNRTNDIRAGVAAETGAGLIDLDLYRNEARNEYGSPGEAVVATNVVRVVKLSDLLKIGASNTIRAALEYRNNLGTSPAFYRGTISYDDYAASLMWNSQLSSKVALVNAFRVDYAVLSSDADILPFAGHTSQLYNNTTIFAPSFNSGIVYAATAKDTLRLTASRGLQMPSLVTLGLQIANNGVFVAGVPTLSPTSVWNLDFGYDRQLAAIQSDLTLDVFVQRNTKLSSIVFGGVVPSQPTTPLLLFGNIGSSDEAGIEIGLKGKSAGGLRWNAGYRLYGISQDITSGALPLAGSNLTRGTPANEIILGGGYTVKKWEFDLNGRWQTSIEDYTATAAGAVPVQIGNYVTLAGRIGYNLTSHITLAGSAEQFNLARIRETAGLLVERRFIASATVHF